MPPVMLDNDRGQRRAHVPLLQAWDSAPIDQPPQPAKGRSNLRAHTNPQTTPGAHESSKIDALESLQMNSNYTCSIQDSLPPNLQDSTLPVYKPAAQVVAGTETVKHGVEGLKKHRLSWHRAPCIHNVFKQKFFTFVCFFLA